MDRRRFIVSTLFGAGALSSVKARSSSRDESLDGAESKLRITDVEIVVTNPMKRALTNFVVIKISTNEPGIYGWGDSTCTGSELGVAKFLEEHIKPALIGRNPMRTENIWQTLYLLPYYRSGSVHMSAVSGVDMALWDIKGKIANLPVYELLGGKTRDRLLTYKSAGGNDFMEVEDGVRQHMEIGYKVMKVQVQAPGQSGAYGAPRSESQKKAESKVRAKGAPPRRIWEPEPYLRTIPKLLDHLRSTIGEEMGLLHDCHERVTPSQAIRLAHELEPYHLFYLEDPLRPEHLDTFRTIRNQSSTPLAMGEIFTGKWEGKELITEHLIDYVRHDLSHVGGITTGKKIATLCEPYGILTAWHGPPNISPIAHMANCHVSLSIQNFGIQEFGPGGWGDMIDEIFSAKPKIEDGYLTINDNPGLGIEVNLELARKYPYKRFSRPTIRRSDDTPWAY